MDCKNDILKNIKNKITIEALDYFNKNENFDQLLKQLDRIVNGNMYDFKDLFNKVSIDKQREMRVVLDLCKGDYDQAMDIIKNEK